MKKILSAFTLSFDESVFEAGWNPDIPTTELKEVLITTNKGDKTLGDFVQYIADNHKNERTQALQIYIANKFSSFVEKTLTETEK